MALLESAGAIISVTPHEVPVDLSPYDALVISPGPGHPACPEDIRFSQAALESGLPVWGICLGHQLMATFCGGTVEAIPARHGQVVPLKHSGAGLFTGLPAELPVVCYNSLAIIDLPPEFSITATAPDGTIMAIEHKTKPWFGVQFHPESFSSVGGLEMARNFLAQIPRRWELRREVLAGKFDAALVASALFASADALVWLRESGRDLFAIASGPMAEIRVGLADPWKFLAADIAAKQAYFGEFNTAHPIGWFGAVDYEATTGSALLFADRVLVVEEAQLVAYELRELNPTAAVKTWTESILQAAAPLADKRFSAPSSVASSQKLQLRLRHSAAEYAALVEQAQRRIAQGDSYEICLTTAAVGQANRDISLQDYLVLRAANHIPPHGSYLRFGELQVLSASPERFIKISQGVIESKPIKGTRPRHSDPILDQAAATDLATHPKDRAENLMILDLVRHDLAALAKPGSVTVPSPFAVESFKTVHQLVSTVRAELAADAQPIAAVAAAFPGGSMTGAPKERTMEILAELESHPRGIYSGAIGRFSLDNAVDTAMPIRTLVVRGKELHYGVGGAILGISDPAAEYQEILVKARALHPIAHVYESTTALPIVDSWYTAAGHAPGLELHFRRFAKSCPHPIPAEFFAQVREATAVGEYFPRIYMTAAGIPEFELRKAPKRRQETVLFVPKEADQRRFSHLKGPDLNYLAQLRATAQEYGGDDAVLLHENYVVEAAHAAILFWDTHSNTARPRLICPTVPDYLALDSITAQIVLAAAQEHGYEVQQRPVSLAQAQQLPGWVLSSLHGVTSLRGWVDNTGKFQAAPLPPVAAELGYRWWWSAR